MRPSRRSWLAVLPLLALTVPARAAMLVVTSASDAGAGSLRATVAAANAADEILFDASLAGQTITLTTGQIAITQAFLTIDGGTNRITISGNKASRVFDVASGAALSLKSLTIRDGRSAPPEGQLPQEGGGIRNKGTLLMADSTVEACYSEGGGAGIGNTGTLVLDRCTLSENFAFDSSGGGIVNYGGGQVAMTNCTVSGNVSDGDGGAVASYDNGSAAVLKYCTIAYNIAAGGEGGGVAARQDLGGAPVTSIEATILAYNKGFIGADCGGTIVSNDDNVITDATDCAITGFTVGNSVGFDPRLGSLQHNGGRTRTHALSPGSIAIDWLHNACTAATDQRGLARAQDGEPNNTVVCDAGAYEAAKPIVVNSLSDPGTNGECSLRMALTAAATNTAQGALGGCMAGFLGDDVPDRIRFSVTGTITLASRLITSGAFMLDGPGADRITIGRILPYVPQIDIFVPDGGTPRTYVLAGVTFDLGNPQEFSGHWVDFYNDLLDTVSVDRCIFRSTPLRASGTRSIQVSRSTFFTNIGNVPVAVQLFNTRARLVSSTVSWGVPGTPLVLGAGNLPGGPKASLSMVNSTIQGIGAIGLAAAESGVPAGSVVATYRATIFAGFTDSVKLAYVGGGSPVFQSLGYNISTDAAASLTATGDLPSTDPKLGVLAYNGGPIPTLNLKPDSPAKDHIPASALATAADQRNFPRPFGGVLVDGDVGAIERVVGGDVNGDGAVNVSDVLYLINFLFAGGQVPVGESDVNGDGAVSVADILYLINRLFAGGPAPI